MWMLEADNQSNLETGIEHNILRNFFRVNRGRKSNAYPALVDSNPCHHRSA
ncbi:hypothetical protein PVAP13_2KG540430 [Panicum virgatum]|uniref:Uncharacterized protein n=1 Tax=Panicum virgatum TaxID=38727 RepID=A0A8T0WGE0_PANVG|nr:hypothetical protein PVAP13_2KG540430 [Panicum virgatum]